jgi:hypothetical protein
LAKKIIGHVTPWTTEELRRLEAYSKAGTSIVEITGDMKRTEGALRQKARFLGIGLGHRRPRR